MNKKNMGKSTVKNKIVQPKSTVSEDKKMQLIYEELMKEYGSALEKLANN